MFAATNNGVIIILWQVIFISSKLNCNEIYLTQPGLVWVTVCVYPFEYESENEETKYPAHFFIYIYMWKYRCVNMNV